MKTFFLQMKSKQTFKFQIGLKQIERLNHICLAKVLVWNYTQVPHDTTMSPKSELVFGPLFL